MKTKRPNVLLLENGDLFGPVIEGDRIQAFYSFTSVDLANRFRGKREDVPLTFAQGPIFNEYLKSLPNEEPEEKIILVVDAQPTDSNIKAVDLDDVISALNKDFLLVPLKYKLILNRNGNYEMENV
jgi:hypothetical protein